jgi:hypothetical protein
MIRFILFILSILLIAEPASAQPGDAESSPEPGESSADAPLPADTAPGFFSSWDGRVRLRAGVARIQLSNDDEPVFPIYFSMNYRVSTNALPSEPEELRLGIGAEVGIFYLYPYVLVGPELYYGDFYLEGHGGATFIFLVGSDTPDGTGATIGGLSAGWVFGSEEILRMELQVGADVIKLLKGKRSTAVMPHITVSFRF